MAFWQNRAWTEPANVGFHNFTYYQDNFDSAKTRFSSWLSLPLLISGLLTVYVLQSCFSFLTLPKIPFAGYAWRFEPRFLAQIRYTIKGQKVIEEGYKKFKDTIFYVSRSDKDIAIVPNDCIEELKKLPDSHLNSVQAQTDNTLGKYSMTDVNLKSFNAIRVLQTKLTPNLASSVGIIKDEMEFAFSKELRNADDWARVNVHNVLLPIVARISARVFVGDHVGRNEDWLKLSVKYTESAFASVMILRLAPAYVRPLLSWFLPTSWRLLSEFRKAKAIIRTEVEKRRTLEQQHDYEKPFDYLQWMIDGLSSWEAKIEVLAQYELLISMAAIHTTSMAACHAIYNMCANPQYIDLLREEIYEALGGSKTWHKTTMTKLVKLDSFMKESQRMNPPNLLAFHRKALQSITLSNGLYIPAGEHIPCAAASISLDRNIYTLPNEFYGLRYYRLRQQPENAQKYQFTSPDKNDLHFGIGRHSCPGRFFAAIEIKMILAHLLLNYDFKYPEGIPRPGTLAFQDWASPDSNAIVLLRKRR